MPLFVKAVGSSPKESPIETHAVLAWTMNFAAACNDFQPRYINNAIGCVPEVHPLFLASCVEIIGAWASLYKGGATKAEVIKHTFAHYSFDTIIHKTFVCGDTVKTDVALVGVGQRRSGGHFVTNMNHTNKSTGDLLGQSWWGGILLGYDKVQGDLYTASAPPRLKLHDHASPATRVSERQCVIPAAQAHIWDACIRNTRKLKSPSSDINVHTNVAFAKKAGLPHRTLNGLCVLAFVIPTITAMVVNKGDPAGRDGGENDRRIKRVACVFGSPVFVDFAPIELTVQVLNTCHLKDKVGITLVTFQVLTVDGKQAIREGYLELLQVKREHKTSKL
eukprot:m.40196 g.40196  ORF g.40196 m.40196 type:complete len:334 (+) comp18410_c0_seq1:173-1174(+)